jgi:TP901 family phage tail tape measure protein
MPMRFGEMVLVIRTQDYASRNLNRLSQNLGKMSKLQELQRRQQSQLARQGDLLQRRDTMRQDISNLRRRLDLEQRIYQTERDRRKLARGISRTQAATSATGQIHGAGGRFLGASAPIIAQAQAGLAALTTQEARLRVQHQKLLKEIALTNPALARMGSEAAAARLGRLENSLDGVSRRLKIVRGDLIITGDALNQIKWDNVHRQGQAISRFGRVMQLTGLIATGSFIAAGNAAANFGQSVTLAATQTRDIGGPLSQVAQRSGQLQEAILGQMQKFPASAEDMSNAAYEIFSSLDLADKGRIKFWRGLQILEKANKVAVAGGIDLSEAMSGLIITLNNFDPELDDVNSTLDTMFDIVRFGNIRVSDFTQMMTKVAPAAKGVGHELEDIGGSLAFLTQVMQPARVATGFSRLEDAFSNRDFIDGVKVVSKARLGEALDIEKPGGGLKPFMTILEDMVTLFPELEKGQLSAQEFFKIITSAGREQRIGRPSEGLQFTAEGRRAFTQLVQNMDRVRELQDLIMGNQGEFNRAFAAMAQTPAIQWKIFINQLKAVALEIGTAALPALLGLASHIQRLIEWWRQLDPAIKSNIIRITVVVAVLTLLGGIVASVVGGLRSLYGAMRLLAAGIGVAGGAGLAGRLGLVFTMLRALSLIGAITITVAIVFKKSGLSNWIDEQAAALQGALDKAGAKGAADLIGLLRDLDRATGLVDDKKPAQGIFNPDFKLFPGGITRQDRETWKSLQDAQNTGIDFDQIVRDAKRLTIGEERAKMLKDLEQIRQQFANTGTEASDMADTIKNATEQAEQSIDQAAQNMTNIWMQFREENAQAFGQLFSGPFFQSETWSLAEEWDVKPSMKEINRDLRQQIAEFKKYRNTVTAIGRKKGATPELMKELSALGPDAMKFLDVLRRAAPGAWNQFISLWKTKQREIDKATQIDFDKQLAQWFKYGKGIAQQIILGLRSENVALDNAFRKYITEKFPNIVTDAQAAAAAEHRANQPAKPGGPKKPGSGPNNSTNNSNNVVVIVHPQPGETTKEALKRGAWEYKNGRPKRGRDLPPPGAKIVVDRDPSDGGGLGKKK